MIRKAKEQDLLQLLQIEQELFQKDAWDEKFFLYEMHDNPYSTIYVYEQDNRILGFMDLWIAYENAELSNIAVKKEFQNQGIAKQLMQYMMECIHQSQCTNVTLEVRVSNEAAIHLYESFHFQKVSKRKHYYENGEDAFLMMKEDI